MTGLCHLQGFAGGSDDKESACNTGDSGLIPMQGRYSEERKGQNTPVFLPGQLHGQTSLADYSPWGCEKLDMTERLTHTHTHTQYNDTCKLYLNIQSITLVNLGYINHYLVNDNFRHGFGNTDLSKTRLCLNKENLNIK